MLGNMMSKPLLISSILTHAEQVHSKAEIVTRTVEGPIHRYTYTDAAKRTKQLANALNSMGVELGDRIATLAWNTHRHYETYYAISCIGAITHTINPRLFPEQIVYIANHAEDKVLFLDLTFVPLVEALQDKMGTIEKYVIMTDREHMPETTLPNVICYEELIAEESDQIVWPEFDENTAAGLCYTSGTTGNPKGALYSHRSTVLHTYAAAMPDSIGCGNADALLPVVPMFHVFAWGVPYFATMVGAKIVFPGPHMDGESLHELIEGEQVTTMLGVPTVWLGLLDYLRSKDIKLSSVKKSIIGGSAAPLGMIKEFQETHDVFVLHAWGMTELSPLGCTNSYNQAMANVSLEERYKMQLKQGRPVFGIEFKVVNDAGEALPHDGKSYGRLLVRGPWVVSAYFRNDDMSSFEDGWFDTGDVVTMDENANIQIVDRKKDVIKSGGEWISSIDLENIAVSHPDVKEACVIGVKHPKWDERPLLFIVKQDEADLTKEEILDFVGNQVATWWKPDDVVFVDELPHTATGKLLKLSLREEYMDHLMG